MKKFFEKIQKTKANRPDTAEELMKWIEHCIGSAPIVKVIADSNPQSIQAGMTVYVITKHHITDYKNGTSNVVNEIVPCKVMKVVKTSKIMKFRVCGHYQNQEYYESSITEKAIGKTLFVDEEAKMAFKKVSRQRQSTHELPTYE